MQIQDVGASYKYMPSCDGVYGNRETSLSSGACFCLFKHSHKRITALTLLADLCLIPTFKHACIGNITFAQFQQTRTISTQFLFIL